MLKSEELSYWAVETLRVVLQSDFIREAVWPVGVGPLLPGKAEQNRD